MAFHSPEIAAATFRIVYIPFVVVFVLSSAPCKMDKYEEDMLALHSRPRKLTFDMSPEPK